MASEYSIYVHDDGKAHVDWWTDDNLDQGYPTEEGSLRLDFDNLEDALKHSGGSRYGMFGQKVTVYLNDIMCDDQGKPITEDEREGSPDGWEW